MTDADKTRIEKEEPNWVTKYNSEPIKKLLKEIKPEEQALTTIKMLKEALEVQDKEIASYKENLKHVRNKAIDECIYILETETGDINAIPLLESLKFKPE